MNTKLKIWMNFENKDLKKGDDFKGQRIYKATEDRENEPLFEFKWKDKNTIQIQIGFGYIEVNKEYFINQLKNIINPQVTE